MNRPKTDRRSWEATETRSHTFAAELPDLYEANGWGLRFRIEAFDPEQEKVEMTVWEHESVRKDFVVMQAVIFPQINWLWLGCILMTLGSFLAVRMRIRQRKASSRG